MLWTILGSDQVNAGKNGVTHRNQQVSSFGLLVENEMIKMVEENFNIVD